LRPPLELLIPFNPIASNITSQLTEDRLNRKQQNTIKWTDEGLTDFIIDAHRHAICPDAAEKTNRMNSVKAHDYAGGVKDLTAEINRERSRIWNRKMADSHEQVVDLDAAGIDIPILQPPLIGYYYWTEPAIGAELSRMVNENTACFICRYPDRFLGWATVRGSASRCGKGNRGSQICRPKPESERVTMTSNVNGHGLDE
jgi:hypothetical protein